MKELFGSSLDRLVQGDFFRSDPCPSRPFRVIRVIEPITAPVADEVTIHRFIETGLEPDDLAIAGAGDDVASEGAVDAEGGTPLKVPAPAPEAGRLIRVDARRAEIDEISGERAFQGPVFITAEIGTISNLHGAQVAVTGKFLVETAAPPAVDAAVHLVLDEDAEILVMVGPLLPEITPQPVAACHGHVLEQAVARLHRRPGSHGDGSS